MATSGSISRSGSWATATLSWSRTSVDITNNRSVISYTLSLYRQYNISSSASKDYSVVINGSTVASGTTTIGGSGTKTIKTGSVTIPHNSNGTKTFSFSFSLEMAVTLSGTYVGTLSNSGSGTLDTIPRTSQITVSDSSINYGSSVTIYTNRASSSFTHTLRYSWNGNTGTIATGVGTSYAWTVPNSFMNYIPSATSTTGTIYCDTYSGSTKIGTDSLKITTSVPSSIVPSFSSVTHSETVSAVSTLMGSGNPYVQGLSKINIGISGASGTYGSSIKSYKLEFDGTTWSSSSSSSSTFGLVKGSGTLTARGTITDSRGRTATKTASITVLPYSPPEVTAFSSTRSNSDGTVNEVGTYAKVTRSASISSLKVGTTEKNTLTYTIKTKPRGGTTWTTNVASTTLSAGSLSLTGTNNFGTFDITTSYDLRIEVADKFNTTISIGIISTGQVTMSWGSTGIGIGKVWESGGLDMRGVMNIEIPANNFGGIKIHNPSVGYDPTIQFSAVGGEWSERNDDSNNNVFEWRWNNVRKMYLNTNGTVNASAFESPNPNNADATVHLGWDASKNVSRIRYGGNGTGANGGLEIQGLADDVKIKFYNDGTVYAPGNIRSDGEVKGQLYHSGNYLYVYSYSSSYGAGYGRIWYNHNSDQFEFWEMSGSLASIKAKAFNTTSKREIKTNIVPTMESSLEKIKKTTVYNYQLKEDFYEYESLDNTNPDAVALKRAKDPSEVKVRTGLIYEEAPEDIAEDGTVDMYGMVSMSWKAIQELADELDYLKMKISRK
jgi:Siphovirus protein of unknown function (DUF859)